MTFYLLDEIIILKVLYTYKWTIMAHWDDDFLAMFLFEWNLTATFFITVQRLILGEVDGSVSFNFLAGIEGNQQSQYGLYSYRL
jgi:hypothetical protein